jgi:prepilin-type N-terminal cleavage/methylation domain-containing protein
MVALVEAWPASYRAKRHSPKARPGRRARTRGFTLLELMNVLTLLLVLLALGMYLFARYERHAKTVEAVTSVTTIARQAAAYYNTSEANAPAGFTPETSRVLRHFPPSSKASVPPDLRAVRGARYQSSPADWSYSPWRELNFSIPQPQYYAYGLSSSGVGASARATVIAQGDLDGDGDYSRYALSIAPDDNLTAIVSPTLERTSPEE